MGGGGWDWQDAELERENERRHHVCETIEERITGCDDIERLRKMITLAEKQIQKVEKRIANEEDELLRLKAYQADLDAAARNLRRKHGLKP